MHTNSDSLTTSDNDNDRAIYSPCRRCRCGGPTTKTTLSTLSLSVVFVVAAETHSFLHAWRHAPGLLTFLAMVFKLNHWAF
jgi:hypothetical protein